MNSLIKIIIKLKIIVEQIDNRTYTYRDISNLLNIKYPQLRKMALRNRKPYREICNFCYEYKIDINHLLYNQTKKITVKYFHNVYIGGTGCYL